MCTQSPQGFQVPVCTHQCLCTIWEPRGLLRGTESYLSFLIELKKKKTTTTPTDAVKLDFIKPEDLRGASYLVIWGPNRGTTYRIATKMPQGFRFWTKNLLNWNLLAKWQHVWDLQQGSFRSSLSSYICRILTEMGWKTEFTSHNQKQRQHMLKCGWSWWARVTLDTMLKVTPTGLWNILQWNYSDKAILKPQNFTTLSQMARKSALWLHHASQLNLSPLQPGDMACSQAKGRTAMVFKCPGELWRAQKSVPLVPALTPTLVYLWEILYLLLMKSILHVPPKLYMPVI